MHTCLFAVGNEWGDDRAVAQEGQWRLNQHTQSGTGVHCTTKHTQSNENTTSSQE